MGRRCKHRQYPRMGNLQHQIRCPKPCQKRNQAENQTGRPARNPRLSCSRKQYHFVHRTAKERQQSVKTTVHHALDDVRPSDAHRLPGPRENHTHNAWRPRSSVRRCNHQWSGAISVSLAELIGNPGRSCRPAPLAGREPTTTAGVLAHRGRTVSPSRSRICLSTSRPIASSTASS